MTCSILFIHDNVNHTTKCDGNSLSMMILFTILFAEKLHSFSLSGHTNAWHIAILSKTVNVPLWLRAQTVYSVHTTWCPSSMLSMRRIPLMVSGVRCDDFESDYYRFRICRILLRFQPIDSTLYYYHHSYGTIVGCWMLSTNLFLAL